MFYFILEVLPLVRDFSGVGNLALEVGPGLRSSRMAHLGQKCQHGVLWDLRSEDSSGRCFPPEGPYGNRSAVSDR